VASAPALAQAPGRPVGIAPPSDARPAPAERERVAALNRADAGPAPGPTSLAMAEPRAAAKAARAEDPQVRYAALRAQGALQGAFATFPGCAGETWRKVEKDGAGRVVKYSRHGTLGGVAFEAELFYAEDGALRAARYRPAGGTWREARLGAGGAEGIPAAVLEPARAADAGVDAPPRCGD
jgi:hypothetical protein